MEIIQSIYAVFDQENTQIGVAQRTSNVDAWLPTNSDTEKTNNIAGLKSKL